MKAWEEAIVRGSALVGCYLAVSKILPAESRATDYLNEIRQRGDLVLFADGFTMCCDRTLHRSIPRISAGGYRLPVVGRKIGMVMGRYIAMKHGPSVTRFAANAFVDGRHIRIVYGISNL